MVSSSPSASANGAPASSSGGSSRSPLPSPKVRSSRAEQTCERLDARSRALRISRPPGSWLPIVAERRFQPHPRVRSHRRQFCYESAPPVLTRHTLSESASGVSRARRSRRPRRRAAAAHGRPPRPRVPPCVRCEASSRGGAGNRPSHSRSQLTLIPHGLPSLNRTGAGSAGRSRNTVDVVHAIGAACETLNAHAEGIFPCATPGRCRRCAARSGAPCRSRIFEPAVLLHTLQPRRHKRHTDVHLGRRFREREVRGPEADAQPPLEDWLHEWWSTERRWRSSRPRPPRAPPPGGTWECGSRPSRSVHRPA